MSRFLTLTEIAKQLERDRHQVVYVIRSRGIKPLGRAGSTNVYAESDVPYIESELRRIAEERGEQA